ncbi:MAG: hypothetical protein JXJ19_02075 [Elusimicrobia bacterium]|nr:hypothetical protein [Elusimicrobiota bacterium]
MQEFKKMLKYIIMTAYLFFLSCAAHGKDSPLSDKFFNGEMPDSSVIGRGGAGAGIRGNAFSSYWNPAGASTLDKNKLAVSANIFAHSEEEDGISKRNFPLGGRNINMVAICGKQVGIYYRPLSDRIEESTRTESGMLYEDTVDAKINQYGVTVAVPHSERMDFGMNINYLSGVIGYSSVSGGTADLVISDGYGWGLDWGLIYKTAEGVTAGVSVMNAPAYIYWEDYDDDRLPVIFRAGIDIRLSQLMALGLDYQNGSNCEILPDEETVHVGIEQFLIKSVVIRLGVYGSDFNEEHETVYTAGIGYSKQDVNVDLAVKQYYDTGAGSEIVRRVSVSGVLPF